jgi:hypothetical protein
VVIRLESTGELRNSAAAANQTLHDNYGQSRKLAVYMA